MANDTQVTVVGNVTADPELKYIGSGNAVANFTIASTPRSFDKSSGEWRDGDALFLRCNAWREFAENITETLVKGSRVVVQGRLKQRSYEKNGEKRTVFELEVDEIGPSLKYATASIRKKYKNGSGHPNHQAADNAVRGDLNGAIKGTVVSTGYDDEPPF